MARYLLILESSMDSDYASHASASGKWFGRVSSHNRSFYVINFTGFKTAQRAGKTSLRQAEWYMPITLTPHETEQGLKN